jgi:predicted O-methyltransferase YrrM
MKLIKKSIKKISYKIAPRWADEVGLLSWQWNQARELLRLSSRCQSPAELVAVNQAHGVFAANQKPAEVSRLLELVAALRPRHACEIGSYNGGNLFLISQMCASRAKIVSIDIDNDRLKRWVFPRLAGRGRSLYCINADSHLDSTRVQLERILNGHPLDFLFIDGDHSYAGVRRDFELYSPLVRSGGVIALHDIVPDHRSRPGVDTSHWAGEVPVFWDQIKRKFNSLSEFIDEPDQDGYGIGVLYQP